MALCASLSLALFSCAPQSSTSHHAAHPASPIASHGACKINAKLMCARVRGSPILINGMTADKRMLEQNSPRTAWVRVSIPGPHGHVIAEVRCLINTQFESVIGAEVLEGAPLTDEDVDYLRKNRYCVAP